MRKIVKNVFLFIKCFIIFIALWATSSSLEKNVEKLVYVEQFKARGVFQDELSTNKIKFYKVTANEKEDSTRNAFIKDGSTIYPGTKGDILVSTQATLVGPMISGLVSFYVGGHATVVTDEYNDYEISSNKKSSVEATGLEEGENRAVISDRSYWSDKEPFNEVIGLRVNLSDNEIDEVISNSVGLVGDKYNYSFLFDTDIKSYCSDIVTKAFLKVGVNLNKDSFATTIYDLIVADQTYISYYSYYSDDILNVYYLG